MRSGEASRRFSIPDFPAVILLVAGPSGAGKSTFIQCLRQNLLPTEVMRLLPESAGTWRVFEANDVLKRSIAVDSLVPAAPDDGVILHYDTAFGRRLGVTAYERDPAFAAIAAAATLVVVSIHPSPEALQAQFESRSRDQRRRRGWARQIWRRAVHAPARALARRLGGKQVLDTSRIYLSPNDLARCYREWTAFARSLVQHKPGSRLICLEPRVGHDGNPTFVLLPQGAEAIG